MKTTFFPIQRDRPAYRYLDVMDKRTFTEGKNKQRNARFKLALPTTHPGTLCSPALKLCVAIVTVCKRL